MKSIGIMFVAALFVAGLLHLWVRLRELQVEDAASYGLASARQSVRRVQTSGLRGRILDRTGRVLAGNRLSYSIVCEPAVFQKRTWEGTVAEIRNAIDAVSALIGRPSPLGESAIRRHVSRSLAMPLVVWRDIDADALAVFEEHAWQHPGFGVAESAERTYPYGALAAHLIGYVGRDRGETEAGDERISFFMPELRGRAGLELYYDSYLRGVCGEKRVVVDARGFAIREQVVAEPQQGPDLRLALDARLQNAAERELRGVCGACVAIDPRDGDVLAMASAPAYDLNSFLPTLRSEVYGRLTGDPEKPLVNRAAGAAYEPGSTFKPVTALAALSCGHPADGVYSCAGVFELGDMRLHCASRWGHGELDLRHALMRSCNPFFCELGMKAGTNALLRAARAFGLGSRTGIDLFRVEKEGLVGDAEWKARKYGASWYGGDLALMAIGQGLLLVTPLQMAVLAGAIGTGRRVTPHLRLGVAPEFAELPFAAEHLRVVREGMRMVVAGDGGQRGSGRLGGEGLDVAVSGKTGTAEVGEGAQRRKNTWFIAWAPSDQPRIAVSLVVENGESGGTTAAPRVRNVLKEFFR